MRAWLPSGDNTETASGRLLVGGRPVAGARIAVDRYVLKQPTGTDGRFSAPVDVTVARRHVVKVADLSRARVGGRPLTSAERAAARAATGGFSVAYRVNDLKASSGKNGNVVVTGRIATRGGFAPAGVSLFTYRLSGRITGADGKPVAGATVVTRTVDRDFWTFSEPSDADGNYTSFFAASDKSQDDPVPLSVQVALGSVSYSSGLIPTVKFKRLRSARMDVQLPARVGAVLPLPTSTSYAGRHLPGAARRRLRERTCRQAGRGAVAGREGPVPARSAAVDARQDGAALAEQLPGLRDLPGQAGRRGRPAHVADGALAARLDRHRERPPARLAIEALPGVSRAGL